MAKISLRAYNRDIENLIERGQTEEAIAQCRYILKVFPKHIDTYRLLGKTYLESQRYTEAADVLQRVLSAEPDDFVSQLGMSIIREDEGNLDAAIWHMERAFEIQPSNTAVQDELRRLYGRRDGVEPPKVRLTRGALVRMYARGDLYPQAIAEARAALSEAPSRIDIEVILARMYFLSGQKVEATEVSSRLVARLPYCYEANRILAEILPETSRAEDAKAFRQTVSALDPYYTFISPNAPTSNQVPDNAVTLEQMEWEPGEALPEQPAWASTIGAKLEQEPQEDLPDWLSAIREAKAAERPVEPMEDFFPARSYEQSVEEPAAEEQLASPAADLPEAEPADESDIPEWMRDVGWSEATGPEQAPPPLSFKDEEEAIGDDEPVPADIPDWLKSLAPEEEEPLAEEEDNTSLDMLASLLPELEGGEEPAAEAPDEDAFTAEAQPAEEQGEAPAAAEEDNVPDWLHEMEMTSSSTTIVGPEDELADWLSAASELEEADETEELPAAVEADSTPAWLQELERSEQQPEELQEPEKPQEPQTVESSWVPESLEEAPQAPQAVIPAVPSDEFVLPPDMDNLDDAMAWLELLAAQQGADEETLITRQEDRKDVPPEWVREEMEQTEPDLAEAPPAQEIAEEIEAAGAQVFAAPEETVVEPEAIESAEEVLAEAGAQSFEIAEEPEAEAGAEPLAEAPDVEEIAASGVQMFEVTEELLEEPQEAETPQAEAIETGEAESDFPAMPDFSDEAAAFSWLESLASQHGADEETLLTRPEDRLEKPPEWVQEEAQEEIEEDPLAAAPQESQTLEAQAETEAVETPEETEVSQPQAGLAEAVEEAEATEAELPAWLDEIARSEETSEDGKKEDELLDWFEALSGPEEETTQPVETAEASPVEATTAPVSEAEEAEDIPDWLRALEQEEGAPAEAAEVPEWLQEIQPPVEVAGLEELGIASEPVIEQQPEPAPQEPQIPEAEISEAEADTQEIPVRSFNLGEAEEFEAVAEVEEPVIATDPQAELMEETEEAPAPIEAPEAEQPEETMPLADLFPEEPVEEQPEAAQAEVIEVIDTPQVEDEVETPQAAAEPEEVVAEPPEEVEPEVVEAEQPAAEPVMAAAPAEETQPNALREQALALLEHGKVEAAIEQYSQLIESDQQLDEVIQDLRNALYRHPVDITLWQALGDAYLHNNQIQDALDSYTKAEELLR